MRQVATLLWELLSWMPDDRGLLKRSWLWPQGWHRNDLSLPLCEPTKQPAKGIKTDEECIHNLEQTADKCVGIRMMCLTSYSNISGPMAQLASFLRHQAERGTEDDQRAALGFTAIILNSEKTYPETQHMRAIWLN